MEQGEQIVTSGQFLLDSESNAREAIKKMLAAKKQVNEELGDTPSGRVGEKEVIEHEGHNHLKTEE